MSELLLELKTFTNSAETKHLLLKTALKMFHSQVEPNADSEAWRTWVKKSSGRLRNDQVLVDLKLCTCRNHRHCKRSDELFEVPTDPVTKIQKIYFCPANTFTGGYAFVVRIMVWRVCESLPTITGAAFILEKSPIVILWARLPAMVLRFRLTGKLTDLLGFDTMNYNVVYAQMGRGKWNGQVTTALASVAATISKMAFDTLCLHRKTLVLSNFRMNLRPDRALCRTRKTLMFWTYPRQMQ